MNSLNSYQCEHCSSSFTRMEHLTRHARSHTNARPYTCEECGKSFARVDVLRRHTASHQAVRPGQTPGSAPRACRECATSRVRCTREQPSCGRCTERDIDCLYPTATASKRRRTASCAQPASTVTGEAVPSVEGYAAPAPMHVPYSTEAPQPAEQTYDGSTYWGSSITSSNLRWPEPMTGMSIVNWLSPGDTIAIDWNAAMGLENDPLYALEEQNMAVCDEMDSSQVQAAMSRSAELPPHNPADAEPTSPTSPIMPAPSEPALYVESDLTRLPFRGHSLENISVIDGSSGYGSPRSSNNGSCGDVLTKALSPAAYDNLVHQLQSNYACPTDALPPFSCARLYFQLYFRKFHAAWPFLPPVISYYEQPSCWLVLLAVVAIGAMLSTTEDSHAHRDMLSTLLATAIARLATDSRSAPEPGITTMASLPTVQAVILDTIFSVHHDKGDVWREGIAKIYSLVEMCHEMALLKTTMAPDDDNDWTETQMRIRAGLMIWMLDSVIAFQFSREPLLRLADAFCSLPNSVGKGSVPSLTVPKALEVLYMEKGLPPKLDELGTNVLIWAIYRRTKESFQQHQTRLFSWTPTARVQQAQEDEEQESQGSPSTRTTISAQDCGPVEETWPPSLPILSKWRNAACDSLDILHWHANSTIMRTGGWEHPSVLSLHLARLVLLTPSRHLQGMASRSSAGQTRQSWSIIAQWVLGDQYKARLAVVHAGALLWHIRRFRSSTFLEPFAVYMATLVLWAYNSALQLQFVQANFQSMANTPSSSSTDMVDPSFFHLDRPIDDELVQAFVRQGFQMAAYIAGVGDIRAEDAAKKLLQVGIRILLEEFQPRGQTGSGHERSQTGALDGQPQTAEPLPAQSNPRLDCGIPWGIGKVYARRLGGLLGSDGS